VAWETKDKAPTQVPQSLQLHKAAKTVNCCCNITIPNSTVVHQNMLPVVFLPCCIETSQ
jgi:hypothetical protein